MKRMHHLDLVNLVEQNKNFNGLFFERIKELSAVDFLLEFSHNQKLFISLNNRAPFIAFNPSLKGFPSGGKISSLTTDLRRFLSGRLSSISVVNNDTILCLRFLTRNNVLDLEEKLLFIELIPSHPQLVLVSEEKKILAAFRYSQERGKDGRLILKGATYDFPKVLEFANDKVNSNYDYYHAYHHANFAFIKRQNYKELYVYLEANLKKLERLKENYLLDLKKSENIHSMYAKADLLIVHQPEIRSREVLIDGEKIDVDPRYNALVNAELIYKKAKKIKRSEAFLKRKLQELETRILYLQTIEKQLFNVSDEGEISAIIAELNLGVKKVKNAPRNAEDPYLYEEENITIMFGKNNVQNDHLTFKIARKTDTFLHVKNAPGSHLIITGNNPSKKALETAGLIALFLSKKVDGEIMYTRVQNVKKGSYPGQVMVVEEETFFLRYDESFTSKFKDKHKRFIKSRRL